MNHQDEFADLLEQLARLQYQAGRIAAQLEQAYRSAGILSSAALERQPTVGLEATENGRIRVAYVDAGVAPARQQRRRGGPPINPGSKHQRITSALKTIFATAGPPVSLQDVRTRVEQELGEPMARHSIDHALKCAVQDNLVEKIGTGLYQKATPPTPSAPALAS